MHAAYHALKNLTEGAETNLPEAPGKEADPVSGLPAHAASDENRFTALAQQLDHLRARIDHLKDRVDRVYWQLSGK